MVIIYRFFSVYTFIMTTATVSISLVRHQYAVTKYVQLSVLCTPKCGKCFMSVDVLGKFLLNYGKKIYIYLVSLLCGLQKNLSYLSCTHRALTLYFPHNAVEIT